MDRRWLGPGWRRRSGGFTIAEVLVSVALITTIATGVASVLVNLLFSQHRMLRQTDEAESLRLAAALITEDARVAVRCQTISEGVRFLMTPSDWIDYRFVPDAGNSEIGALHRVLYLGGGPRDEKVAGFNLVAPSFWSGDTPGRTWLECQGPSKAEIRLAKPPGALQSSGTELFVSALLRGG